MVDDYGSNPGSVAARRFSSPFRCAFNNRRGRHEQAHTVVEDQEDNRQILRDLLSGAGYEMTEAWDGEAGVNAAKEQRPDLILMDIQLPLMDGHEATRRIKADPELKNIPIIVVTSYALSGPDHKR